MTKRTKKNNITDNYIEILLGNLLRTGVIIAGTVVIIGAIMFLIRHGKEMPDYNVFKANNINLFNLKKLFANVLLLRSSYVIELGILLLIATPVLRVIFSIIAFLYQKDYLYVIFTMIVLVILIYSLFS